MNQLVAWFINRSLLVNLLTVAVLAAGVTTLRTIKKEGFPAVDQNRVIITTLFPGASPLDVETNVTIPLEEVIAEVAGIQEYQSVSRENVSTITVTADDSATEKEFEKFMDDLDNAVMQVTDLPDDVEGRPVLKRMTSDDMPIIELAVSGPAHSLRKATAKLESTLRRVRGVASVKVIGLPDEEFHILVDPTRAREARVDLQMIYRAVQGRNLQGTGGTLESFISEKKIVSLNQFENPEQVLDTWIRMSPDGRGVRLRDVARLVTGEKDNNLVVRNNGSKGASVLLTKASSADTLDTVDNIRTALAGINLPAGVKIADLNDQSALTRNRIRLLSSNAFMGLALVIIVLFIVFNAWTAVWTAFGIPFSLLGAFWFLPMLDITLNAITIGSCVIVLGMLVDDAIVVSEQISQYREKGLGPIEAGVRGTADVWKPITASAMTSVIAFYPISRMGGLPGKFVWVVPVMIGLSLLVSLIESFFVLPNHTSHGRSAKKTGKKAFVLATERLYQRVLDRALRWRYACFALFLVLLAGAGLIAKNHLVKDPFPQESAEGFHILVTLPHGAAESRTIREIGPIERALIRLPESELDGFSIRVGTHSLRQRTEQGTQSNLAAVMVYLTPYSQRDRTATEIMNTIRTEVQTSLSADVRITSALRRLGPPLGRPFEIRLSGHDDELRREKAEQARRWLSRIPGVSDVEDDVIRGRDQIELRIDYTKLARTGLQVADVLTALRIAYDGIIASDMVWQGKSIDYRIVLDQTARTDIRYLNSLPIMNRNGHMINLGQLLELSENPSRAEIRHIDGERTIAVFGQLDKEVISPAEVLAMAGRHFQSNEDISYSFAGEPVENQKIFGNLGSAGLLALLGTWIVITLIFGSMLKPLIVMSAIPFGLVGVVGALYSHDMAISMFSAISMVGLTGIIVNDSIVMVYTINGLTEAKGHHRSVIIEGAVSRLRPIMLTSLTTILGLIPTAYGIGGYDAFISPMCLALAWGLLFATTVLLFLVPILYFIGYDIRRLTGFRKAAPAAAALLAATMLLPDEATAKGLSLPGMLDGARRHPDLSRAGEVIAEATAARSGVDSRLDSRLRTSVQTGGQSSVPDISMRLHGYTEDQTTRWQSLGVDWSKTLGAGPTLHLGAETGRYDVQLGTNANNSAAAAAAGRVYPSANDLWQTTFRAGLSMPLFRDFGGRELAGQRLQAGDRIRVATLQKDGLLQQLQAGMVSYWWNVALAESAVQRTEGSLKRARTIHARNLAKRRLGIISKSEIHQSQLNILQKTDDLAARQGDLREALLELNHQLRLFGMPATEGTWPSSLVK